jgi:hypothetical protein
MSNTQPEQGGSADASIAGQAQEKVQQTAQQASQKTAQYLRDQTETRAGQASEELSAVAQAMRRSGHSLHADGKEAAGAAIDNVTGGLERLSRYLGETDGDRMLKDLESFGRRNPWGMIGLGLGVGLVASRFLKASSQSRYRSAQPQSSPPRPPALPQSTPYQAPAPSLAGASNDGG